MRCILSVGLLAALIGCGTGGGGQEPSPSGPAVTAVTPALIVLTAGPTPFTLTVPGEGEPGEAVAIRFRAETGAPFQSPAGSSVEIPGEVIATGRVRGSLSPDLVAESTRATVEVEFSDGHIVAARDWTLALFVEQELSTPGPSSEGGWGDVDLSADVAVAGVIYADGAFVLGGGAAHVFARVGTSWVERQKLSPAHGSPPRFGQSVAVSGERILIGAPGDERSAGLGYMYVRDGDVWTLEQTLSAPDTTNDSYGWSVDLDGDTAIVGCSYDDEVAENAGAAYVYTRGTGGWALQQKVFPADLVAHASFARDVAVSGDTLIASSHFDDDLGMNAGAAYVFVRSGTMWTQQQKLHASDGATQDYLGEAVVLHGDTAVAGSWLADDVLGAAWVFERSGDTWTQARKLVAPSRDDGDNFGPFIAVYGNQVAVGASGDGCCGTVHVWRRSASSWTYDGFLEPGDGASGDRFGQAVAAWGGRIMVKAPNHVHGLILGRGAAYIY